MNAWQEGRLKEFCDFYKWPIEDTRKMFENSREFFELVWRGMDPKTREEEEVYYNGPWLTLRQMSYTEDQGFPDYYKKFISEMKLGGYLLDYGCGVGDTLIYAYNLKVNATGVEVPGKGPFLNYRKDIRKGGWIVTEPSKPVFNWKYDRAILSSILDHVPDPVGLATKVSSATKGPILATPCIDETYDRPTHAKWILKNVPAAFEVINEHNNKIGAKIPA